MAKPKKSANTLSELADNIAERQLTLRDQAAIERKEMSSINKKIHAFGGEAMLICALPPTPVPCGRRSCLLDQTPRTAVRTLHEYFLLPLN